MEKIISSLREMQVINSAYSISTEHIVELQSKITEAKVCTPIIGKFSSGKSALINTLLGCNKKKILKEDITPETAIPVEILYTEGEESVMVVRNDGSYKSLLVEEYRNYEADVNTMKCARIFLRNDRFLKKIPDVMLVDMPGFESGFEIHNKAIDNYLPQSLAYVVAFPADDMIVRSSIGNILKELCLHDMPLCVVITKYDKKNDDFENTLKNMKESLKRFVGDRDIRYCITSSFTGDAEELETFLEEIQEQSQDILAKKYTPLLLGIIENTENYLKTTLNNSQLSESELNEREEKLNKQMSNLETQFSKEQGDFDLETGECIEEIKNDVQQAMEGATSNLVAMAMSNQNINDQLNNLVRNTVTVSIKKRFIPRMEKYLKRVANCMDSESIGDVRISFHYDAEQLNKGMTSVAVAMATGFLIGLPFISIITGLVAGFVMKLKRDKKREEAKQQIRMKLQSEVYPQVLREVGKGIEMAITKQITLVNTSVEEELATQKNTLEKAMADVRSKMMDEKAKKENLAIDITKDLERLEEIKHGL